MFGFKKRNHHDMLIDQFIHKMKDPEAKWVFNGTYLQLGDDNQRDIFYLKKNQDIMVDGKSVEIQKVVMKVGSIIIKHYEFTRAQRNRLIEAYNELVVKLAIRKITGNEQLLLT